LAFFFHSESNDGRSPLETPDDGWLRVNFGNGALSLLRRGAAGTLFSARTLDGGGRICANEPCKQMVPADTAHYY